MRNQSHRITYFLFALCIVLLTKRAGCMLSSFECTHRTPLTASEEVTVFTKNDPSNLGSVTEDGDVTPSSTLCMRRRFLSSSGTRCSVIYTKRKLPKFLQNQGWNYRGIRLDQGSFSMRYCCIELVIRRWSAHFLGFTATPLSPTTRPSSTALLFIYSHFDIFNQRQCF